MIDIRIMAHSSRYDNVMKILSQLSLSENIVVWDDRECGGDAMYTARKAWNLPIPNGCTHRLVLQDDIEICDSFLDIIDMVAQKHPSQIVSFFHCERYDKETKYVNTNRLWGCAVMIPTCLLKKCWEYIERIPDEPWCTKPELVMPHDTDCIMLWSVKDSVPIINTVPSLVQHIGDNSLVGMKEKRIAKDFVKSPPITGW